MFIMCGALFHPLGLNTSFLEVLPSFILVLLDPLTLPQESFWRAMSDKIFPVSTEIICSKVSYIFKFSLCNNTYQETEYILKLAVKLIIEINVFYAFLLRIKHSCNLNKTLKHNLLHYWGDLRGKWKAIRWDTPPYRTSTVGQNPRPLPQLPRLF